MLFRLGFPAGVHCIGEVADKPFLWNHVAALIRNGLELSGFDLLGYRGCGIAQQLRCLLCAQDIGLYLPLFFKKG